jgi:hypothetical protein
MREFHDNLIAPTILFALGRTCSSPCIWRLGI